MAALNPQAPDFISSSYNTTSSAMFDPCYYYYDNYSYTQESFGIPCDPTVHFPCFTSPPITYHYNTNILLVNSYPVLSFVSLSPVLLLPSFPNDHLNVVSAVEQGMPQLVAKDMESEADGELVIGDDGLSRKRVYHEGYYVSREKRVEKKKKKKKKKMLVLKENSKIATTTKDDEQQQQQQQLKCIESEGKLTTVMIKNIPNQYTRRMLMELLDRHCKRENGEVKLETHRHSEEEGHTHKEELSEFDFLYLPIDFKSNCNKGYAFVNFTHPIAVLMLNNSWSHKKWPKFEFDSNKICELTYANIQGKEALKKRFESSVFPCQKEEYLPVCFNPAKDGSGNTVQECTVGRVGREHNIISRKPPPPPPPAAAQPDAAPVY